MPNMNADSPCLRSSDNDEYRRAVEKAATVLEVKLSPALERSLETDPEKRTAALLLGVMRKSAEARKEARGAGANFDPAVKRRKTFREMEKLEEVKSIFSAVPGLKGD